MRFLTVLLCLILSFNVLAKDMMDLRTFGSKAGATLYLFTSPSCPHCGTFHKEIFPDIMSRYVKTNKAELVIVDMPYDWLAMKASMLMRCLPEEKSTQMMNWLYENQSEWSLGSSDVALKRYARKTMGMTGKKVEACLQNEALFRSISDQRDQLSKMYDVHGWPTIVVRNGNIVEKYSGTDKRAILDGLEMYINGNQEK